MEFDLDSTHRPDAYKILSSLVSPRPIAWVTTLSKDGIPNTAPFSFFNVFGSKPPIVAFSPGNKPNGVPKDTAQNIIDTNEFVINIVSYELAQAMADSAKPIPADEDELALSNLQTVPSSFVAPPRIEKAPAALECRLHSIQEIGENRLVIGTVHRVHTNNDLFAPETMHFNQEIYHPLGRMASPHWYARTDKIEEIPPQ